MTEYRYYLHVHVINYPQGVVLHWPVDIPAVGGGSQNGAEDAASPMADLSCRCLVVIVGLLMVVMVVPGESGGIDSGDSIAVFSSGIVVYQYSWWMGLKQTKRLLLPADLSCKFLLKITALSGP